MESETGTVLEKRKCPRCYRLWKMPKGAVFCLYCANFAIPSIPLNKEAFVEQVGEEFVNAEPRDIIYERKV